jgi:hypothetical protein
MDSSQILEEIKRLPPGERLTLIEATLHTLRAELPLASAKLTRAERRRRLADGARALLADYRTDKELTVFSALDGEDIYEYEAERSLLALAVALKIEP